MPRPLIAIDVDDVLADNAKGFIEFSNQRWGTNLAVSDYIEDWTKMWQVDHGVVTERSDEFFGEGHIRNYDHLDGAFEVLTELKKSYDLIIVTARRQLTKGDTLAWIQERFPNIFEENKIFFAGFWDTIDDVSITLTKGQLVKELGADYLIDDQLKHCQSAVDHGLKGALLFGEYGWNQAGVLPEKVARVKNWKEVLEYFNERTA